MAFSDKIKVLIVDDSFFMRKLLLELFLLDPSIEVVGEACDGEVAVSLARSLSPDVITMDYHMPKKNGAMATKEIIAENKKNPPAIIMLSAYTKEGAEETFTCLEAGAFDFLAKPSGELSLDIHKVKEELLNKVHAAYLYRLKPHNFRKDKKTISKKSHHIFLKERKMILIGASTGGPVVVEEILRNFYKDFNAFFLVVQHMPEFFIDRFAERLSRTIGISVEKAKEGEVLKPGIVYLVSGVGLLNLKKKDEGDYCTVHYEPLDGYQGALPSIDAAMISAAKGFGKNLIGVVMTGMGDDGKEGSSLIKVNGGYVIAQSPETSAVDSMPKSVIVNGFSDEILAPRDIAKRLLALI